MDSHPGLGVLTTRLPARALRLLDGAPDVTGLPCDTVSREEIGEYLRRYYVSTGRSSTRFHHILASDPQPDLHDHPWDYVTHLLSGSYLEHTESGDTLYVKKGPLKKLGSPAPQIITVTIENLEEDA